MQPFRALAFLAVLLAPTANSSDDGGTAASAGGGGRDFAGQAVRDFFATFP